MRRKKSELQPNITQWSKELEMLLRTCEVSQVKCARLCGVTTRTITNWLTGKSEPKWIMQKVVRATVIENRKIKYSKQ